MGREEIMIHLKDILLSIEGISSDRVDRTNEDTELFSDLGLSSFELLYVAITIEEEFNIRFNNINPCDMFRVGNVIDYISAQLK